jgi:hypothetical protein
MAAYADGVAGSLSGNNFLGMALNDRSDDAEIGKVGLAPRGSEGILRPSFNPTLDKLVIASGISVGDASLGLSNNKLFAQSQPPSVSNPPVNVVNPATLGVALVYPYDNSKVYAAGNSMYINVTTGLWTNASGDAGASPLAHGTLKSVVGNALQMLTF